MSWDKFKDLLLDIFTFVSLGVAAVVVLVVVSVIFWQGCGQHLANNTGWGFEEQYQKELQRERAGRALIESGFYQD